MYLFETERLRFRELTSADAPFAFDLNSDPLVMQYTGDPPFENQEAAESFLENYAAVYRSYKYGRWGVELKSTGELLGWCGLKFHPEEKITDVGYRFFRKNWGNGYATEAALATIQFGFSEYKLERIVAHARKENAASLRALEKCGMKIIGEEKDCDGEVFVYDITTHSQAE